jgi:hypothetical protein
VNAELEQARQARRVLEKVRARLLRPTVEALDCGAVDLSVAAQCLQRLETSLAQGERRAAVRQALGSEMALESEIAKVRRELRCVQALVAGAGKFHAGWGRLMAAADEGTSNYTAAGDAARPRSVGSGRVVMHG